MYTLTLFLTYLLRKRVCLHSLNVTYKYCIVITPVEQSLQPIDYTCCQKQHATFLGVGRIGLFPGWGQKWIFPSAVKKNFPGGEKVAKISF